MKKEQRRIGPTENREQDGGFELDHIDNKLSNTVLKRLSLSEWIKEKKQDSTIYHLPELVSQ